MNNASQPSPRKYAVTPFALARSLMAFSQAAALATTHSDYLIRPLVGVPRGPTCTDAVISLNAFCQIGHLEGARWLLVGLFLLVASGYRPRITGILHWWAAFSIHVSATAVDGGDQVAILTAYFLLPICLLDNRRWHWEKRRQSGVFGANSFAGSLNRTVSFLFRLQVAGIYYHAAIGKLAVEEWRDGTVLYYWLIDPVFGPPNWLLSVLEPIIYSPAISLVTWTVLIVEHLLSVAFLFTTRGKSLMLVIGLAFHGGIILLHGITGFSLIMFGLLFLYLRPWHTELPLMDRLRSLMSVLSSIKNVPRRRYHDFSEQPASQVVTS